jgi:hypothetical protein
MLRHTSNVLGYANGNPPLPLPYAKKRAKEGREFFGDVTPGGATKSRLPGAILVRPRRGLQSAALCAEGIYFWVNKPGCHITAFLKFDPDIRSGNCLTEPCQHGLLTRI